MIKTGKLQKTNFIRQNLPALLIFLFLPLYGFTVICRCKLKMVEGVTYLFHCVDFSFGFCSKLLPGAIYNLFVSQPSQLSATVYEYIRLVIFYAVLAFMLQKWLNTLPDATRPTGIRLLLLYLTGSCTFAAFIYQPGMLDVSWVYLSVIFILCMQNKYTRFLCPLLAIPAVMVHYGVMLCYIPFWALLLLYEVICSPEKKEKRIWLCLFFTLCFFAVGTFFYFITSEKQNVTYDIYTFNRIVKSRGANDPFYYDYALYFSTDNIDDFLAAAKPALIATPGTFFGSSDSPFLTFVYEFVNQFLVHFLYQKNFKLSQVFLQPAVLLVVLLPMLCLFYGFARHKIQQHKKQRLTVFFYFCMMCQLPFSLLGSLFVSTDSVRWLIHGFLCLFTLTLYIIYKEGDEPIRYIKSFFAEFPSAVLTLWQIIYALVFFAAYIS